MKSKLIVGLLFCAIALSNHGFAKPSCGHENTKAFFSDFDNASDTIEINAVDKFDCVYTVECNSTIEVTAAEISAAEKQLVIYFERPDDFVRYRYSGDTNIHYLCSKSFSSNRTPNINGSLSSRRNARIKPMFEPQKIPSYKK